MTDCLDTIFTKNETNMSWSIKPGTVSEKKNKQNTDMTDRIDAFYAKNDIILWWPIGLGTVCDKNQTG